jgi:hypothetical protein
MQFALSRRQAMYALYISFEFSVTLGHIEEREIENTVTHMTIARQRLCKESQNYGLNNRKTSISRQQRGKHPLQIVERRCFPWCLPRDYIMRNSR